MRLQSIHIERLRSVRDVVLEHFGEFNVLIGKNNSGKSSILAAIDTFFTCVRNADVVTLTPPFGQQIDFWNKEVSAPIEITVGFSLSLEERDTLLQDIIVEAPQMRNATVDVNPDLEMFATICIVPSDRYGFVRRIAIRGAMPNVGHPPAEKEILSINRDAAHELFERMSKLRTLNTDLESLQNAADSRLDYFFNTLSREREAGVARFGYALREVFPNSSRGLQDALRKIGAEASSVEDLKTAIQGQAAQLKDDIKLLTSQALVKKISTFSGEEATIPAYVRNLLQQIASVKVLHLKDRRRPIGSEEAQQILNLKIERGGSEKLRAIQEPVQTLLGVQIDAFRAEEEENPFARTAIGRRASGAELDVDDFLVEVNGSGIQEALRVILDTEFQKPQILLVEEPEIHLHPALETGMMRYLKRLSSRCQVFLTTHSTNFLDTAEMKNVYLVSKDDATQVRHISLEEAGSQLPKELGLRLSSLFMFDRLVFVEGESDETVLREVASTMKINLSQHNVGFVIMGGATTFAHYAQENVLSLLSRRQVRMLFLLDRDEREDSEIVRMQERCSTQASLKVLDRREIENYLIWPRALAEFITLRRRAGGRADSAPPVSEDDVRKAIDEVAEEVKHVAIDKRVAKLLSKPFYPDRKRINEESAGAPILERVDAEVNALIERLEEVRAKSSRVHEEQSQLVESQWENRKMSLVPGDVLLDKVCQRYGTRFRKESGWRSTRGSTAGKRD